MNLMHSIGKGSDKQKDDRERFAEVLTRWIMDPSVCVTVTLESGEHTLSASEMPKGAITLRITFER